MWFIFFFIEQFLAITAEMYDLIVISNLFGVPFLTVVLTYVITKVQEPNNTLFSNTSIIKNHVQKIGGLWLWSTQNISCITVLVSCQWYVKNRLDLFKLVIVNCIVKNKGIPKFFSYKSSIHRCYTFQPNCYKLLLCTDKTWCAQ